MTSDKTLFDLTPSTGKPVDLNDLDQVEEWAQAEQIEATRISTRLGPAILLEDKVCLLPNPIGKSSEDLRDLQASYRAEGKQLYYIYFWEVDTHKLLAHFKSKLGKDSRKYAAKRLKCEVISNKEGDQFMKDFHIQGLARGTDKVSIALKTKDTDEILAVQQFAKYRFGVVKGQPRSESTVWEGLRLCFKPDVQIYGGATRLQKFFEERYTPTKIIGYINMSHSAGGYKAFQGFTDVTNWDQFSYMWVLEGEPKEVPIIDKHGVRRVNDLEESRRKPVLNPNQMAGVWGKGVGQLFYSGKLGSRKQLREHEENGELVHNDEILRAIGYTEHFTAGQCKWEKVFERDGSGED